MSRILVTGGAGFIGCNAVRRFTDQGHKVAIYDDCSRAGSKKNLEWLGSPTIYPHDVVNPGQVNEAVEAWKPDVVLHLAAQTAVTTSVADPRRDFEVNALGTFNFLEAVRKHCPKAVFIYSSTNKVYGEIDEVSPNGIPETQPMDFHSPYGCSKGAADQYVRDYARIYGLNTVVLRQSCIYGPRQFGVEDQGWLAHFCIQAAQGKTITIYGDGHQIRDVLWIDDLLNCYEACISRIADVKGEVFNIGGGPKYQLSLRDALSRLSAASDRPFEVRYAERRPGDQQVYVSDIFRASFLLGWEPKIGSEEGLMRLYGWVKENLELFA